MKKITAVLLVALMAVCFAACGSNENKSKTNYTPQQAAEKLVGALEFGEELEQTDNEITLEKYGIDASLVADAARFAGSGATADEVAVFECVDEEAVKAVSAAIDERVAYLKDGYASYGPGEVPKIENAVVIYDGLMVCFCISNNSENAESIYYGN